MKKTLFWCGMMLQLAVAAGAASITVDAAKPGVKVNSSVYGLFFEEINHAGDGGLYAEMVRNRGFEDYRPAEGTTVQPDGRAVSTGSRLSLIHI